jgi:hypothetical protein
MVLDEAEGAEMLMVKPTSIDADAIRFVRERTTCSLRVRSAASRHCQRPPRRTAGSIMRPVCTLRCSSCGARVEGPIRVHGDRADARFPERAETPGRNERRNGQVESAPAGAKRLPHPYLWRSARRQLRRGFGVLLRRSTSRSVRRRAGFDRRLGHGNEAGCVVQWAQRHGPRSRGCWRSGDSSRAAWSGMNFPYGLS